MSAYVMYLTHDEQRVVRDALQQYIDNSDDGVTDVEKNEDVARATKMLEALTVELLRRNGLSPTALDVKKGQVY